MCGVTSIHLLFYRLLRLEFWEVRDHRDLNVKRPSLREQHPGWLDTSASTTFLGCGTTPYRRHVWGRLTTGPRRNQQNTDCFLATLEVYEWPAARKCFIDPVSELADVGVAVGDHSGEPEAYILRLHMSPNVLGVHRFQLKPGMLLDMDLIKRVTTARPIFSADYYVAYTRAYYLSRSNLFNHHT
ncbi:hypothetical protein M231_00571 [Tremella mesenterica]|uniref:Uncharacterized protein n=1 Tax=Tremella mesenterica TaxID=5217 RepID=A0A4Q1BVN9_TREME|nr:hypothetical protein M231_00571 [Tremella mesenterica]